MSITNDTTVGELLASFTEQDIQAIQAQDKPFVKVQTSQGPLHFHKKLLENKGVQHERA